MSCVLCGGDQLQRLFGLGSIPLGFPLDEEHARGDNVWRRPLDLDLCRRCLLGQTVHKVPAESLEAENHYMTEGTRTVVQHDRWFAETIPAQLGVGPDARVLEIGCGDGSLLDKLAANGFSDVFGLEPSPHPDKEYGYDVIPAFLTPEVAETLRTEGRSPDLIVANYVLELVPNLADFMTVLGSLGGPDTQVVVEVPYLVDFLHSVRVDGFAHLRCNWFTVSSLVAAFERAGMTLTSVDHDDTYRGGTLRVVASRAGSPEPSVGAFVAAERERLDTTALEAFRQVLDNAREKTVARIRALGAAGTSVYGYGGGLKSSTLVNWLGLTADDLPMTVDIDPNKQRRFIPGANIPIEAPEALLRSGAGVAVLMLALDHAAEIEEWLHEHLPAGSTIVYPLPEFRTVFAR